ncbi:hypothetical protein [Roseibium sp. MMSF_3412]|uniref:hypothetical protein n=1 Tax=Roseibium sp. MMSF_3412 TaxID=3046712 RepID=UPI00273F5172|nr:hypothetical protein [Roseibium sp. MMSF_3412]
MANTEHPSRRDNRSRRSDLRDAKPLLQAIFLGMTLAVGLVVAAAMANSDAENAIESGAPVIGQELPSGDRPAAGNRPAN